MSWRPVGPYMHDGHRLHPKLSYALPAGMGEQLRDLGLFVADPDPADIDLSGLPWAGAGLSDSVVPASLGHEQAGGESSIT